MGTSTTVVIAVTKEVMVAALLTGLPDVLQQAHKHVITEAGAYWRFNWVNWYRSNAQITALYDWLYGLPKDGGGEHSSYDSPFAVLTLQDDAATSSEGSPDRFNLAVEVMLTAPL